MILYYIDDSKFGKTLVARGVDGICACIFGNTEEFLLAELNKMFPKQSFEANDIYLKHTVIDPLNKGMLPGMNHNFAPIKFISGTSFQQSVWQAIRYVPIGTTLTYTELAKRVGNPNAVRAVATACAKNPIAIIIPCHRILPKSGEIGNYRWGQKLKAELLQLENYWRRSSI